MWVNSMPNYDFSRFTSYSFEQFIQALAIKVLGPGVVIFGDGPDGGREATFERKVPYPSPDDGWNGYGVVQAKCRQRLSNTYQDGNWAVDQLKKEIEKYTDPKSTLRKPEYFIYATNVVLTPAHGKGSKDRAKAVLEDFKEQSPLIDYAIWDYDQIRAFLDAYEGVRNSYAAFITPGDVLSALISKLRPTSSEMYDTLVMFLEKELLSDECVNLEQAGHDVEERIPLATVFVDLPTRGESANEKAHVFDEFDLDSFDSSVTRNPEKGFIKDILAASSERLDQASMGRSALAHTFGTGVTQESSGRFVLIGGPGQGKTTLTQFLCQIFRASIISGKPHHTLSPELRDALNTIQEQCKNEGINHKVVPRFPFKVILNDFAKALSNSPTSQVNSVLAHLARQITNRTNTDISVIDLRRFIQIYPIVIIFDGLDEVPASSNRDQVLEAIREFWIDASNANADILAIATSRPQGYNEDFSPAYYRHRHLAELSDELGWHFAQRLAEVRYRTDEDRKQKVLDRLKRAFKDGSTTRLMRSPLQVTIMTALVDRVGQPPQARWNLFNSYYDVIYLREVERSIPSSTILRDYEPDIKAIHNHVGFFLQVESERTGGTDAKLSRDRFVSLVEARLRSEGHSGQSLTSLAKEIVDAASQRLVFLVEVESEQIGFEIRSLQEFMAAESLMSGVDQVIKQRLEEIAPIPFWRNVFLFAAGKCFAERQELRDAVHSICAALNELEGNAIAGTHLAGSDLAVALLEEGSSRRQPRFENLLARIAIKGLDIPKPDLQIQLADVYKSRLRTIFQEEIELRLMGSDKIKSFGAWNCLLRLAESKVVWAIQLANDNWPTDPDSQTDILQAVFEPTGNTWLIDKLLDIVPNTAVETLSDVFQSETSRNWPQDRTLEHDTKAAVSVLVSRMEPLGQLVNVLGTSVSYGPVVRLIGNESELNHRLRNTEGWHPSWHVHRYGDEFSEAPSKESLAHALKSLARLFCNEGKLPKLPRWSRIPWPLLACLYSCTSAKDLHMLSIKSLQGDLGDLDDWLDAESRWFHEGITREDLISMTDSRMPFDAKIREEGFPTTISEFGTFIHARGTEGKLEYLLDIFNQVPDGKTRFFVARTINWLIFAHYLAAGADDALPSPNLDSKTLRAIYQALPADSFVPLDVVSGLANEPSQEIAKFFDTIGDKDFQFESGNPGRKVAMKAVEVLRKAYYALNEDAVLLPILSVAAEKRLFDKPSFANQPT